MYEVVIIIIGLFDIALKNRFLYLGLITNIAFI